MSIYCVSPPSGTCVTVYVCRSEGNCQELGDSPSTLWVSGMDTRLQAWQQVSLTAKPSFQPSNMQLLCPNMSLVMKKNVTSLRHSITIRMHFTCQDFTYYCPDAGGGQRATLRVGSLRPHFMWIPSRRFRSPGLHSHHFYWLSHLTSSHVLF